MAKGGDVDGTNNQTDLYEYLEVARGEDGWTSRRRHRPEDIELGQQHSSMKRKTAKTAARPPSRIQYGLCPV
jgi:hypothetical protein